MADASYGATPADAYTQDIQQTIVSANLLWKFRPMSINRKLHFFLYGSIIFTFLSGCSGKSRQDKDSNIPKVLHVLLESTKPSYKSLFDRVEVIKLESDPQSLIGYLDKAMCIGDSILILDMSRSSVMLFSPDGKFLNTIGERGDGPEQYLMCYDVAYNKSTNTVSVLDPGGILNEYYANGRFISKLQLPSKPNYMACEWMDADKIALWSAVNEDECGVSLIDVKMDKTLFEDWERDRMLDMQRLKPFFQYNDEVKFCPPLTNDVYSISKKSLSLDYTWDFSPVNISKEYMDIIASIENPLEKNKRLISDLNTGTLSNVPTFNGETSVFYYVALQTGLGDDARFLSVLYDKNSENCTVFNQFKEGMTLHPLFMNEDFILSQIPYSEVDTYNDILGLNLTCEEEENPLLVKFYFKK